MLFFAIKEGLVSRVNERIIKWWPALASSCSSKDTNITFHHLANMTSGYFRPEAPGTAYAYNDYAIELYAKTLYEKVFAGQGTMNQITTDASRLGALQFQDNNFISGNYRVTASVRDWARVLLFWMNKGNWNGKQILDASFVERATSTQVPAEVKTKYFDLTGRYGFFWWTNGIKADGMRPWPSAPPKTFAAHGAGRNFIFVIPEWRLVIVRLSPAPGGHVHVGTTKSGIWEEFFSRLRSSIEK